MELVIDTRNGIAGDIVCAGLIGLGADGKKVTSAMEYAGHELGKTEVNLVVEQDIYQLGIRLEENIKHLHESKAKVLLSDSMNHAGVSSKYGEIGNEILQTLCEAEKYVHQNDPRLKEILKIHHHPHPNQKTEAILHEAKDIIIDITGFIVGIEELKISKTSFLDYVNVGRGQLTFSHGTMDVPAPSVKRILETHNIPWQQSDKYKKEMATPTGTAILAGTNAERIESLDGSRILKSSQARGTKKGMPPIKFTLLQ
ncbi:MAG: nickel insertion protein [Candidatus Altiarchaeota archaeon]